MQAFRQWHEFDDKSKSGEIEFEIMFSEDSNSPFQNATRISYPVGSLREQMEAKQKRDNEQKRIQEQARATSQQQKLLEDQEKLVESRSLSSVQVVVEDLQISDGKQSVAHEEVIDFVEEFHLDSDEEKVNEPKINGLLSTDTVNPNNLLSLDMTVESLEDSLESLESPSTKEPLPADDLQGSSALHFAAMKGKEDKLNLLLLQSADPNAVDKNGMTPLHYAAGEGHTGIAAILIEAGANIGAKDRDGDTPIHIALQEQQHETLKYLISKGSDAINAPNIEGNTILHLVAGNEDDYSELLKYLLHSGANPKLLNKNGESALDLAEMVCDSKLDHQHHNILCEYLGIKKTAPSSISGEPLKPGVASRCWTLIENSDIDGLRKMIQFGMDVNGRLDEFGLTPLMLAIKLQKLSVVNFLAGVEIGADMEISTLSGLNALHYIAIYGTDDMIPAILKRNPDPNIGDRKLFFPLHYACERGNLYIVTVLIEGCGSDLLPLTEDSQTPLHVAAKNHHPSVVSYLFSRVQLLRNFAFVSQEQGISSVINMIDKFGNTCLHYLSQNNTNEDVIRLLLTAKSNPTQVNRDGLNALDIAKSLNHGNLIEILSAAAADKIELMDISKQMLMLCYHIQDGAVEQLVDNISSNHVDVMMPVDDVGDTMLHTAAAAGHTDIIKELVKLGAYVYATNSLGCTPLHAAAMQGKSEAVLCLMSLKADPRASDSEGYTPMHYAAGEGHLQCLQHLLDVGQCDETLKTFQGLTVLHVAVTEGKLSVVEYLLQRNPHLAAIPDSDGVLAIDYAKTSNKPNTDIIRLLEVRSRLFFLCRERAET